ncbi:MAG TPA: glucoamylase family protein [Chitinophagales bacterium]|nr:glucoamylase family protein [Chitinophagales bacterium]
MFRPVIFIWIVLLTIVSSCKKDKTPSSTFQLTALRIGAINLNLTDAVANINLPVDEPVVATFSQALDISSVPASVLLLSGADTLPMTFSFLDENKTLSAKPVSNLENQKSYSFEITSSLKSADQESFSGISISFTTVAPAMNIDSLTVGSNNFLVSSRVTDVDRNFPAVIKFDHPLDLSSLSNTTITVNHSGQNAIITWSLADSNKTLYLHSSQPLVHFDRYVLTLTNQIKSTDGSVFTGYTKEFYTALDTTPKFPLLSDDDLLTLVEQQTFKYFWDFGHPTSGLAHERETSGNTVTIGGSGFGVMAIIVGISRNFITRQEGVDRLEKIVDFLTTADRFHGVWPHWMNGVTGHVIPFSQEDDGGDLVETSYMMQGLLTARQFLDPYNAQENNLISKINDLWNTVEWDWYTQGGQNELYWHWSPDLGWAMNFQVRGWNEALITYFLAAGSSTHTISASVYTNGWAQNGGIINGHTFYGFTLPLGPDYGGPLFFSHYSFLGINPHNLSDAYANYWTQDVNHTEINRAYCIDNPLNYVGYSSQCWGLTASDNQSGYTAQSPTNDLGVITPTAAISSMPYTPQYSMEALKFFYYTIGDKVWGPYGFYDAFNTTAGWHGTSDLAIDEGPIIIMIENHRTGLLWNLFMSCPEVTTAMTKLGFTN